MKKTILNISLTALFAALVTVLTFIHLPIGANGNYIHFGDAMVYLAACFLPAPFAAAAGALGGALADYLSGAAQWVLPTVVIKALIALPLSHKSGKIISKRNVSATLPGAAVTLGGYYLAEVLILGGVWAAPLVMLPMNLIQAAGSIGLFIVAGAMMDRAGVKSKLRVES